MNSTTAWYIRNHKNSEVKGPFPGGQITQELLLGRHHASDEVSHDKEEWFVISDLPDLLPDVLTENHDEPGFEQRLAAARRWADERRGVDPIENQSERRAGESYESEEIKRLHRLATDAKSKTNTSSTLLPLSLIFISIIVVIILAFQYSPEDENVIDCAAPAKQGVDWRDCDLSGAKLFKATLTAANLMNTNLQTANLQSADLSHANLKYSQLHLANLKLVDFTLSDLTGANLLGADLTGAVFKQANLSYANFRDANIMSTDFTGARLDHALWVDGRTCKVNSIGTCN